MANTVFSSRFFLMAQGLICLRAANVNFDYLVNMESIIFIYYKVIISLFHFPKCLSFLILQHLHYSFLPFLSTISTIHPIIFLVFFQSYGLLFAIIVLQAYMYTYIPNYNLLSLNKITSMYIFSDDHFLIDNQLQHSSLGKIISPTLSIPQLPVVLCVDLGIHSLFPCTPIHFGKSFAVVYFISCLVSHVGKTLLMLLLMLLGDRVSPRTP